MDYAALTNRVIAAYKDLNGEQETKNKLIEPFFDMLGYDIDDVSDIRTEVLCDFGVKKEKIDYEICFNNTPIILVEAKDCRVKLGKKQINQLYRYFCAEKCKLGILTNGIEYWFFSDFQRENIMDSSPFYRLNVIAPKDSDIDILNTICKTQQCSYGIEKYIAERKTAIDIHSKDFAELYAQTRFHDKQFADAVRNGINKTGY